MSDQNSDSVDDMPAKKRPLSPHLQIYKPQITSVSSIMHRITGVAIAVGSLFIVAWLVAMSMGEHVYYDYIHLISHPLVYIVYMGLSWAFWYHFFNEIRHLFWDVGKGFDLDTAAVTGYLVFMLSFVATAVTWGYLWYAVY